MRRKIRGAFCEEKLAEKSALDARSLRYKKSGAAWLITGCPRGSWRPRARRCVVGTRAYKLLRPARGRACAAGSRRIQK